MGIRVQKRVYVIALIALFIVLVLSGCSDRAKSESEIIEDIEACDSFKILNAEIENLEVVKRQTDKDNRSDLVYVTVEARNDNMECTLSFILQYELYNEGWFLEGGIVRDSSGPWEISGPDEERLISDFKENSSTCQEWDFDYIDLEVLDSSYNSSALTYYEKTVNVDVVCYYGVLTGFEYRANVSIIYEYENGDWVLSRVETKDMDMVPHYSPTVSASDEIMDTFEAYFGPTVGYDTFDSYEYLRSEEDWEDGLETRYYRATRIDEADVETYLVTIPLTFYVEEDGDYGWRYSQYDITYELE